MKNEILNTGRRFVKFALMAAIVVFAASCNKEEDVTELELKRGQAAAPAPGTESIAAIAIGAEFTELVSALVYVDGELETGLVNLFLNGTDQYTVFAPTNDAFQALYDFLGDDVSEITDLPAELVLDVLLYHVVEGRRAANSVVPPVRTRTMTTLLGETFSVDNKGVITDKFGQKINIVAPNISASNGIIHVIDGVLLPL
jgi:uncharacterized surface protein with fasciclin (FAS1) repeats